MEKELKIGNIESFGGYFTLRKFVMFANATGLQKVEQTLGYHDGRLQKGAFLLEFLKLPNMDQFDFAGYSQVASHRFEKVFPDISEMVDEKKAKGSIIEMWNNEGGCRALVKILPVTRHNKSMGDDSQYPPGLGVPQWKLKEDVKLPMKVIGFSDNYPFGRLV